MRLLPRSATLALGLAVLAPGGDELAILAELDDAVIGGPAMAIADIDVALGVSRGIPALAAEPKIQADWLVGCWRKPVVHRKDMITPA
jgi:hypothetical protein